jgi:hypothetical protein
MLLELNGIEVLSEKRENVFPASSQGANDMNFITGAEAQRVGVGHGLIDEMKISL